VCVRKIVHERNYANDRPKLGNPYLSRRSGKNCFPDGAPARVYVVGADGERVRSGMVTMVREGRKRLYEIRMPSDHFAILVRRAESGALSPQRVQQRNVNGHTLGLCPKPRWGL